MFTVNCKHEGCPGGRGAGMRLGVIMSLVTTDAGEEMTQPLPQLIMMSSCGPQPNSTLSRVHGPLLQAALLWPPVSYPATMATAFQNPQRCGNHFLPPTTLGSYTLLTTVWREPHNVATTFSQPQCHGNHHSVRGHSRVPCNLSLLYRMPQQPNC